MRIYAAVIEWPDSIAVPPSLILEPTRVGVTASILSEIQGMLGALDPDSLKTFRQYFDEGDAAPARTPEEWQEFLNDCDHGPFITSYEKEI